MKTFEQYLKQKTLRNYPECLQVLTREDIVELAKKWHEQQVKLLDIPVVSRQSKQ